MNDRDYEVIDAQDVGMELAAIEPEVIDAEAIEAEVIEPEPQPEAEPEAPPKPEDPNPKKTEEERRAEELSWLLDKIVKANEWRRKSFLAWEEAKTIAKERKEIYEGACQALHKYNNALEEIDDRPLLFKCDLGHEPEAPAEEPEAEAESEETESDAETEDEPTDETQPADDWRSLELPAALDLGPVEAGSIGDVVSDAVDPDGVDPVTMDQIYTWFADGNRIVDLDLSDEGKVEFLDRLTKWASGYAWGADEVYPGAMPLTFLTVKHHDLAKVRQRVNARRKKAAKAAAS